MVLKSRLLIPFAIESVFQPYVLFYIYSVHICILYFFYTIYGKCIILNSNMKRKVIALPFSCITILQVFCIGTVLERIASSSGNKYSRILSFMQIMLQEGKMR